MLQSLLLPLLAVAAGLAAAVAFMLAYTRTQRRSATGILSVARQEADRVRADGQRDAESTKSDLLLTAKMETLKLREDLDREIQRRREEWERLERRVDERGRLQERKLQEIETREQKTTQREETLNQRELALRTREGEADRLAQEQQVKLERIAGLTTEDARREILQRVEDEARGQAAALARDIKEQARRTADRDAKRIISMAIQRLGAEHTAESTVAAVALPSDEMKGRIIGREGRNIRAFESVTGVNLIIDDTPEAVLLSCFDPVRREIGRLTLEKLILDGRIHPHRIEEVFEQASHEVERLCLRAAEDAVVEVGLTDLHPELLALLGRLRYRTSYGQNVLKHLVETAHIAGIMAAELRLDAQLIKRCAFLHDIGKALTHEVEGSHALIGADLARKYGESDEVVHAIEAHHNEVQPQTIEAVLTQASDACSGGRPGARRESLEAYVKRLERIEEIAGGKAGVEKVFAMQAGREIRVMVKPDDVDEIGAAVLARDVAKQIEEELTYPGQIRVTVVRESRVTEIAR
jgi:ribonucrease Y